MIRVGINGWGPLGKMVFRAAWQNFLNLQIVAINDLLDPHYIAYLLRYDSVHGRFKEDVAVEGNDLMVNGNRMRLTAERDPANLKWGDLDTDVVVESSGWLFCDEQARSHIKTGAKKVILTVPPRDDTPMFVYGVNDASYRGESIISNASPSEHSLAVLAKVLDDHFGIKRGLTTFLRAPTLTRTGTVHFQAIGVAVVAFSKTSFRPQPVPPRLSVR